MHIALLLAATAMSVATGSVQRCNVCKTANAEELFANMMCDSVPDTAPDCALTADGSGHDFLQHCPENSNCLTISKQDEELRVCTQKQRLETTKTTDGIVMEVCGSNMCNAAGRHVQQLWLALLLAAGVFLRRRLV